MNRSLIQSNSALTAIGRVAIDPLLVGSAVTEDFLTVDGQGVNYIGGDVHHSCGLYFPGRSIEAGVAAVMNHGAGTWAPSRLYGSQESFWNRVLLPPENLALSLNAAGIPIFYPRGYSETGATDQAWASPNAYAELLNVVTFIREQLGANTKLILDGYSMGGLSTLRMVLNGDVDGISAVILRHAVTGLVQAHADALFGPQIEATWGMTTDAELLPYDPHNLVQLHPERVSKIKWFILTSSNDTTAASNLYSDVFQGYLIAAGAQVTRVDLPFGEHVGATPIGFAAGATRSVVQAASAKVATAANNGMLQLPCF
jgi:pimeloyl-ACP methyl ester carboxylesterase